MALIQCEQVELGYASRPRLLHGVNWQINAGECHCVMGATGSGKSSLLALLAGLYQDDARRVVTGHIQRQGQLRVGLVMQDPNVQFVRQQVGAEVAFVLENLSVPSEQMAPRVQQVLMKVGLDVSLRQPIEHLSLGQKYRLMLAAQLVGQPDLILLDEPGAQLDEAGITELIHVLSELIRDGIAIVIVEHEPSRFSELVSHFWSIEAQHFIKRTIPVSWSALPFSPSKVFANQKERYEFQRQPKNSNVEQDGSGEASSLVIESLPFDFAFQGHERLFQLQTPLWLDVGEIALLVGDNGTGKSSLLKYFAGLHADVGDVPIKVLGQAPKLGQYADRLALLLQSPNRQLFESSVRQELEFSLLRYQLPTSRVDEILKRIGLENLAQQSPHRLSYGQQHLIALACVVCLRPQLLLLDDPFAGLDAHYRAIVQKLILELAGKGCAVVIASHKLWPDLPVQHLWHIQHGVLNPATHCSATTSEQPHPQITCPRSAKLPLLQTVEFG